MLPLSYTLAVDGASLDVREMRPGDVSSPECVAVVSHPYGPLGGSQGDPTVVRLVRVFLDLGCRVLTYDARGVGASTGRTSWTARVEAHDFQAVVDYALSGQRGATTVYCCRRSRLVSGRSQLARCNKEVSLQEARCRGLASGPGALHPLALLNHSFATPSPLLRPLLRPSFATASPLLRHCFAPPSPLLRFAPPSPPPSPLLRFAPPSPLLLLRHAFATPSPLLRSASFARVSAPHTARHVLVSYPLGVLWALATLRAGKCREEVKRLAGEGGALLLVHGTADQFTSAALERRAARRATRPRRAHRRRRPLLGARTRCGGRRAGALDTRLGQGTMREYAAT
ncbi:hypothetical protein FA09DRAFT_82871 [Tilletiopsis washingtonensis]|uniref:Xaa-Pro dipeptidyl-peptidase-like domain-containing protein n=1 Tax=Tilletiopsis washingtonensis TaxID=58919 RepID=A0A316Z4M8_9BASI|nr:hypothetical protein FA09DRAFT_82871 [Tilletiopsis washingtonensis]PWN96700.1 hypothetical protein FA09DRAFT_82871 [Tilletiopsis washingtonensis]